MGGEKKEEDRKVLWKGCQDSSHCGKANLNKLQLTVNQTGTPTCTGSAEKIQDT